MASLEFHRVAPELLEGFAEKADTPHLRHPEVYLRLFAPFFIEDAQVLYLDIDVTIQTDITRIMDEVKERQWVYAVKSYDERAKITSPQLAEQFKATDRYYRQTCRSIGMSSPLKYFNSGVMVLDLDMWRRDKITRQLFDYIAATHEVPGADQGALNHLLDGRFGELSPRWNHYPYRKRDLLSGYSEQQLRQAAAHPAISHYVGVHKQWSCLNYSSLTRERYWKYRMRTPWPASKPADRTLRNILWRAYRNHAPRSVVRAVRRVIEWRKQWRKR